MKKLQRTIYLVTFTFVMQICRTLPCDAGTSLSRLQPTDSNERAILVEYLKNDPYFLTSCLTVVGALPHVILGSSSSAFILAGAVTAASCHLTYRRFDSHAKNAKRISSILHSKDFEDEQPDKKYELIFRLIHHLHEEGLSKVARKIARRENMMALGQTLVHEVPDPSLILLSMHGWIEKLLNYPSQTSNSSEAENPSPDDTTNFLDEIERTNSEFDLNAVYDSTRSHRFD